MLTSEKDIDQFLVLQSKTQDEVKAIGMSLGLDGSIDKDTLINQIISVKQQSGVYGIDKPQAISLRTKIGNDLITGGNDLMRQVRLEMYRFNKKKEFTLINPKDIPYKVTMNYLPCSDEHLEKLITMNMILAKPEQEEVYSMLISGVSIHEYEINFINKPAANDKTFVMLHVWKQ